MQETDESLLQSFATGRDEKTFRALTGRYLGLIFHTALRRTGNRQMAEEVSQNVLCALAGKAGLLARHPERLAPWLHRATVFESLKAMRSESSHQRRKQLTHPDEIPGTHPVELAWSDALPVLDASLDKLPETDRTVLLLHFYEGRSFPQIARALGKSAEAVQKQSRRALEKLSRLLRARGVALSVAGLAVGLTAEMAKAAPASLIAASSATAFSTPASFHPISAVMSMKPKILIPATLLVCALPLAVQQSAISSTAARNRGLAATATIDTAAARGGAQGHTRPAATGSTPKRDFIVLSNRWDEIRRAGGGGASDVATGGFRAASYAAALSDLDTGTLLQLIHGGAGEAMDREKKHAVLRTLFLTLAKRDPRLALDTALTVFSEGTNFPMAMNAIGAGAILGHWAKTEPQAAYAWFRAANLRERYGPARGISSGSSNSLGELTIPMLDSLLLSDAGLARDFLASLPQKELPLFLSGLPSGMRSKTTSIDYSGTEGGMASLAGQNVNLVRLLHEIAPGEVEQRLPGIMNSMRTEDLESFLAGAELTGREKFVAAHHLMLLSRNQIPIRDMTYSDPAALDMVALANRLAPDYEKQREEEALGEKRRLDDRIAEENLRMLDAGAHLMDDSLIATILTSHNFSGHLDEALEYAGWIRNPGKRAKVIEKLQQTK